MFDQVILHLDDNILQDAYHSTYRKGHGTETALLRVKSDIDQALGDGDGYVLLVPLDLSTAFGTIDHTILTNRLESQCGIQGTANRLISLYLTGHTNRCKYWSATGVRYGTSTVYRLCTSGFKFKWLP